MPLTSLCKINKPIASLCHIVTYLTRYSDMPLSVTTFLQSPSKNTILPFTHSHPYLSSTTSKPMKTQSQLPSFHPVLHLSSHFPQSNSFFPNFLLTSLCASHIHFPNSSRLSVLTLFSAIQTWKSDAQTQHGYNFENNPMNWLTFSRSVGEGEEG